MVVFWWLAGLFLHQTSEKADRLEDQQQARERADAPTLDVTVSAGAAAIALAGAWTMQNGHRIEELMAEANAVRASAVTLDASGITRLDTLGALAISRMRGAHDAAPKSFTLTGLSASGETLLAEVRTAAPVAKVSRSITAVDLMEDTGRAMVGIGRDFIGGVSFFGGFIAALGRVIANPRRFRGSALVKQIEAFGFRSVPIIALISFLVGGIIAQQSVFQLRSFGTTSFVADLLGVLILRELGVLLTSIMIAGRSGSAITAEIGSMKMREEIDALRTMGLDPMEVLIVPRILALIICLPMLTFVSSMSGLFGGGLVAWIYGDVSPDVFLARLQNGIKLNTFMVGMIKAPVMALVIGIIAAIEGMAVKGSAESLGQQTTASVVKAIFMVIVVDGLFAMFFASIQY
jgi:phospholipid/cholesterol/gamma-HCH transport system permease protein